MQLADIHTSFSGNPLNRADYMRPDPEVLGDVMRRKDARVALMASDQMLTDELGDIAWQTSASLKFLPVKTTVFLGLEGDSPRYAAYLEGAPDDYANMFPNNKFRDGRVIAHKLGEHPSLGIFAQAKSMLLWHESHQYCAKCGTVSNLIKGGYERLCPACNASHFPRTDPTVIMLALYGDKALVGRSHGWPEGHYSALAGYMEPGENMEEAVARELFEEAGLKTTKVRYIASQPWPWPSTLMIGAIAWVEDNTLTIDPVELEDAIWVSKQDVLNSMKEDSPQRLVPPPYAIAHNLVRYWLDHTDL